MARRIDILERQEDIVQWIEQGKSKAFISNQLNCKQETLNNYLKIMNIQYSGNQSGKGTKKKSRAMTLEEYLKTSEDVQTNKIRIKLLQEKIKPHQCECCRLTEWMGKPIPLEVHHIDGNRTNNTIENFALLCPNCHSFTDSYRGKNSRKDKCVETI